jgi:hypothetical protein
MPEQRAIRLKTVPFYLGVALASTFAGFQCLIAFSIFL